jgi:hypothetical protein
VLPIKLLIVVSYHQSNRLISFTPSTRPSLSTSSYDTTLPRAKNSSNLPSTPKSRRFIGTETLSLRSSNMDVPGGISTGSICGTRRWATDPTHLP